MMTQPKWKWSSFNFHRCRVASTDGKLEEAMWIKIAPDAFAEGNSRIARHGRLLTADGWRPVVFKEFKRSGVLHNTMDEYLKQIEISAIAGFLADHWVHSDDFKKNEWMIPVQVVSSRVVQVNDVECDKFYCMEELLSVDRFERWSNNTGVARRLLYRDDI